jgi:tape measure domain-containing protein
MADVTKDLLIKISTAGGDDAAGAISKPTNAIDAMLGRMVGLNQAWELFNKMLGLVKTTAGYAFDALSSLVDTSAKFEQLGVRFDSVFGAGGPAKKALDWAVDFGAKTPLTMEQVTRQMIAMKTYGFDPMGGMMQKLGDTAFALGREFEDILLPLGKMQMTGRVTMRDLMMLAEKNIPVFDILKKEFNLTADEMANIGRAGLDADRVIRAIVDTMGTKYAGAMNRASDTWLGAMSTIGDIWTITKKNIMDAGPFDFLVSNIRVVRNEFSAWMDSNSGKAATESFGAAILGYLTSWRSVLVNNIIPAMGTIVDFTADLMAHFAVVWNFAIDIFTVAIAPMAIVLRGILDITAKWMVSIGAISDNFGSMRADALPQLLEVIATVATTTQRLWIDLKSGAKNALNEISSDFASILVSMSAGLEGSMLGQLIGKGGVASIMGFSLGMKSDALERATNIAAATAAEYEALARQKQIWDGIVADTRRDVQDWTATANLFKIDVENPLNIRTLGAAIPGMIGGQQRELPSVYSDMGTATQLAGKQVQTIQLIAPPGDEMTALMVNYINRAMRAEGTIGAGF